MEEITRTWNGRILREAKPPLKSAPPHRAAENSANRTPIRFEGGMRLHYTPRLDVKLLTDIAYSQA
jgi:hypothetical protein